MRISDWSSDVCSSDLRARPTGRAVGHKAAASRFALRAGHVEEHISARDMRERIVGIAIVRLAAYERDRAGDAIAFDATDPRASRGGGAQNIESANGRGLGVGRTALVPMPHVLY